MNVDFLVDVEAGARATTVNGEVHVHDAVDVEVPAWPCFHLARPQRAATRFTGTLR